MNASIEELRLHSRERAEAAMRERSLFDLEALIETLPAARGFAARLDSAAGPHPRIIAGIERPATAGPSAPPYRPRQIAMGYARVGAAALSVTTEPDEAGGDLDHISDVRPAHLPILRNDVLVTPYQIAQSRVAGADAVLLIARLLGDAALGIMIKAAQRYGVEPLVELSDAVELGRAIDEGARMVAIVVNGHARGMALSDNEAGLRLVATIGHEVTTIARGGIDSRADIDRLSAAGFRAFLTEGQAYRAADPADALWALMQPGS